MTLFAKKCVPWLITFFVAALIALLTAQYESAVLSRSMTDAVFSATRKISDGCFVSGALALSLGGLIAIAEHGGLDALRYALWRLGERIRHPKVEERAETESYYDYVKARQERQKAPCAHFLGVGALFLALSLIFALL